jgi:uncharacterized RDD family membrane protein YckC
MNSDLEYAQYIGAKPLRELRDLANQINKNALPTRYKMVIDRIALLEAENPKSAEELIRDKRYDTVLQRFFAGLVDRLIFVIPAFVIIFILNPPKEVNSLGSTALAALYYFLMLTRSGQTVGMKVFKIRLLHTSGEKAPSSKVAQFILVDTAVLIVSFIVLGSESQSLAVLIFDLANVIVIFSNDKRRSLNNYMSQTVFVNLQQESGN